MTRRRAIVVGAGIGGLSAAVDLAVGGCEVTVLEKADEPGGKMRRVDVGCGSVDAGPTVLTMRSVFEQLFADAGRPLGEAIRLKKAEVLARHHWPDGSTLDLHADAERSAAAIEAFAGRAEADRFRAFAKAAQKMYETLEGPYMKTAGASVGGLVKAAGIGGLLDLASIRPFTTLWRALGDHFEDPRLRQLYGRYATYCGSSPFDAPATLMLIAHAEAMGVFIVDGGIWRLADALRSLAEQHGVVFRFGTPAERLLVRSGRVAGVVPAGGGTIEAHTVVFNGDVSALADGLLGAEAARAVPGVTRDARSLSAVTWAACAEVDGFPVAHHTVFFSADYAKEFDELKRGRLPADPTVYLCAQDRTDDGRRMIDGPERLLLLVNAPADGDARPPSAEEIARCRDRTFARLARAGLTIAPERPPTMTGPAEFAAMFPSTGGALYGRATHGWKAAFERPGPRTKVPGLYVAGGSAHPGAGVPMVALSGRMAARTALKDLASMR